MLEKVGLPAKPSLRGNTWVVDASHCQGCSSQFTFFNRKHHCRRCGGLFCNNCTLQRMYLRGQGDQPVRVCDPCKDLEEAARFTARQGRRNQATKGGSRTTARSESELLQQILGMDGKPQSSIDMDSIEDDHSSIALDTSHSILQESGDTSHSRKQAQEDSSTPDELRQQAQEEKKKYHILKKEGKGEEALQAFKRGKEIERRAEALELSLRKSRRRAASAALSSMEKKHEDLGDSGRKIQDIPKDGHELELPVEKKKKSTTRDKDEKDDISSALKELGWSDADLQDADRKPGKVTLEGELSGLVGESHNSKTRSPGNESSSGIDRTQVLAHKRKALALKREGKLAEAKEELKKSKILEKQLEEQEMIGQEAESDDELAALIRGLDSESKGSQPVGGLGVKLGEDFVFDLSHITAMGDEFDDNTGIDITDDDIHDPEIAAALRSMGWEEENSEPPLTMPGAHPYIENGPKSSTQTVTDAISHPYRDKAALQQDVLSLKREALALKRAGNVAKAMEKLHQAKVIEKELHDTKSEHSLHDANSESEVSNPIVSKSFLSVHDEDDESIEVTDEDMGDPELAKALKNLGWQEADQDRDLRKNPESQNFVHPQSGKQSLAASPIKISKTKTELQKELLGLKRKALALRREGRVEEADAELDKGKLLEKQLEEMENSHKTQNIQASILQSTSKPIRKERVSELRVSSLNVEDDKIEVTDEDMEDPELAKELRGVGWQEADQERVSKHKFEGQNQKSKTKAELQKELLGLKRKALALRREGRLEEADAELNKAKLLEKRLEETETSQKTQNTQASILQNNPKPSQKGKVGNSTALSSNLDEDVARMTEQNMQDPSLALRSMGSSKGNHEVEKKGSPTPLQPSDTHPSSSQTLLEDLGVAGDSKASTGLSCAKGQKPMERERTSTSGRFYDKQDTLLPINTKGEPNKNITSEKQPPNVIDLLTGDTWQSSPLEWVEDKLNRRDSEAVNSVIASTSDISIGKNISEVQVGTNSELAQRAKAVLLNAADVSNGINKAKCDSQTTKVPASPMASQLWNLQQKILSHKRKALALKREGKLEDAKEELRLAKSLEREGDIESSSMRQAPSSSSISEKVNVDEQLIKSQARSSELLGETTPIVQSEANISSKKQIHKQAPGKNRLKLQQESLAHKRRALALRREGKVEEAEAEFELAKSLENQMEELSGSNSQIDSSSAGMVNDDGNLVADILDPQLLSALKGIGWKEDDIFSEMPPKGLHAKNKGPASISNSAQSNLGNEISQANENKTKDLKEERSHLEEKIKAEKLRALNLKRAGKQAEALDALRGAKQLEKKLQSLAA